MQKSMHQVRNLLNNYKPTTKSSRNMSTHRAAVSVTKGTPLEVRNVSTPNPGPNEVLISAKSVAVNPLDWKSRDFGYAVASHPAILGHDVSGTIAAVGSSSTFNQGTRVAAFAPAFFKKQPEYGAFQEKVLVPAENVTPIPDSLGYNKAATTPMAVLTTFSACYTIGIPFDTKYLPSDKKGLLIWSAATSVGTAAVQIAKSMGFRVYATASPKHHSYIKSLGAAHVFDYNDPDVVSKLVSAAKNDSVTIQQGFHAFGALKLQLEVIISFGGGKIAKIDPPSPDDPKIEGVEMPFVLAPKEPEAFKQHFSYACNTWLKEKLEDGTFVPGPKTKVVGKGVESIDVGLDELRAGISGVKLVVEL
jgi:NADPH:quinone reductase-like Zn-dependent oxidoreductase